MKRRLVWAGVAFLLGCVANIYLLFECWGWLGAGHGHYAPDGLFFGPLGLSLYAFPVVCAAVVARWIPGVVAALLWETAHFLMTLKFLFELPDRMRQLGPNLASSLRHEVALYVILHTLVSSAACVLIFCWLNDRNRRKPKPPSSLTFQSKKHQP